MHVTSNTCHTFQGWNRQGGDQTAQCAGWSGLFFPMQQYHVFLMTRPIMHVKMSTQPFLLEQRKKKSMPHQQF